MVCLLTHNADGSIAGWIIATDVNDLFHRVCGRAPFEPKLQALQGELYRMKDAYPPLRPGRHPIGDFTLLVDD
jgi:hypothetical protein